MGNKYYNVIPKVIIISLGLLCVIMYALDIIYSNKAHEILVLMNPAYNSELHNYDALCRTFSSLYILSVQALVFPMLYIGEKNKIKGWLCLIITQVIIFVFCYAQDIILRNFYFKPAGKVLEFGATLLGTSILYLILSLFNIKERNFYL